MPNPGYGLHSGFVRFNTLAHHILRALHRCGDMCINDLREELAEHDPTQNAMGMCLSRLVKYGFIYINTKLSTYDTGMKTQALYSLEKKRPNRPYKRATTGERTVVYRKRKRGRAASIFDLARSFENGNARAAVAKRDCDGRPSEGSSDVVRGLGWKAPDRCSGD